MKFGGHWKNALYSVASVLVLSYVAKYAGLMVDNGMWIAEKMKSRR